MIKSCSFKLHIMLPSQLTPSPKYPDLQVHLKERLVLVHSASSWQLCCPVSHSSTNQEVEVSSLDLNVISYIVSITLSVVKLLFRLHLFIFLFLAQTTDIMISWLKFI